METIATIRKWKMKRFAVKVTAHPEPDLDLSFDTDGSVRRKIDSGEFVAFAVKASVYCDGNLAGSDYLGGCIERNFSDFKAGAYFREMVLTACREARIYISGIPPVRVRLPRA